MRVLLIFQFPVHSERWCSDVCGLILSTRQNCCVHLLMRSCTTIPVFQQLMKTASNFAQEKGVPGSCALSCDGAVLSKAISAGVPRRKGSPHGRVVWNWRCPKKQKKKKKQWAHCVIFSPCRDLHVIDCAGKYDHRMSDRVRI